MLFKSGIFPESKAEGSVLCIMYVPRLVYQSKWFWILLAITVLVISLSSYFKKRKAGVKLAEKRALTYLRHNRCGKVVYTDSDSVLQFDFEFGGGNCVAIIEIPAAADWENATRRRLTDRQPIVEFIASQSLVDQVPGGYYLIKERCVELHTKHS